jgi:tyrosine-protein phosphatase SIW14
MEFMQKESIQFFHFRIAGNKEPFVEMDQNEIASALSILVDQRNHPGKV